MGLDILEKAGRLVYTMNNEPIKYDDLDDLIRIGVEEVYLDDQTDTVDRKSDLQAFVEFTERQARMNDYL
jgi:hypothetical protein